ncbi:hypothetical protein D1AOALGA4SA_4659 [Olavius algarvensis Delta 1 endosymbiont]|nr:hypothetical protein D1AOALGA4SA_4659 [Olavius algarvensis Delta 1 endosymbiont]
MFDLNSCFFPGCLPVLETFRGIQPAIGIAGTFANCNTFQDSHKKF